MDQQKQFEVSVVKFVREHAFYLTLKVELEEALAHFLSRSDSYSGAINRYTGHPAFTNLTPKLLVQLEALEIISDAYDWCCEASGLDISADDDVCQFATECFKAGIPAPNVKALWLAQKH